MPLFTPDGDLQFLFQPNELPSPPHSSVKVQPSPALAPPPLLFRGVMSSMLLLLLLLHCPVLPPSSSSEPLEEHHVAQLLRCFSTDLSLGRDLCLDGALAHHLHQCSYHLRLFRNWLVSGQDPLEYLHGQPAWLTPPPPPPQPQVGRACACSLGDSCFASACVPVLCTLECCGHFRFLLHIRAERKTQLVGLFCFLNLQPVCCVF